MRNPFNGWWNYREVIYELDRQSGRKNVTIQIGDHLYIIKNRFRDGADQLSYKLADKIYKSIRLYNIKELKDHIFYCEHCLER